MPVLFLFVWGGRPRVTGPATAAAATLAIALVLAACGGGAVTFGGVGGRLGRVGCARPRSGLPSTSSIRNTISVAAGQVTFEVTNNGTEEHEFELFKGDIVVDELEGLVPGLTRTLPVTLEAGEYTFACKLAGHDLAGMTGTLTVTGS